MPSLIYLTVKNNFRLNYCNTINKSMFFILLEPMGPCSWKVVSLPSPFFTSNLIFVCNIIARKQPLSSFRFHCGLLFWFIFFPTSHYFFSLLGLCSHYHQSWKNTLPLDKEGRSKDEVLFHWPRERVTILLKLQIL